MLWKCQARHIYTQTRHAKKRHAMLGMPPPSLFLLLLPLFHKKRETPRHAEEMLMIQQCRPEGEKERLLW